LSQFGGQLTVLPRAVRYQETEQAPFLLGFLLCEQSLGVSGQFEELDTFFEIGLISSLVLLDISQASFLVPAPVGRHAIEESGVDSAIELVDIGVMDAVLKAVVFGLKASDRGLVLLPLIHVALRQGVTNPRHDLVIEVQVAQERRESLFEHFLADIRLAALPFVSRAVVVDILLLLHLPDDRATAVAAGDQSRECKLALPATVFLDAAAVHHTLDSLP
jgi:hypothetical protein